jgi:DNA-binding CsgD family transcriptional regulator
MDHNLSCNLVVSGRAFWAVDVSRAVGQGAFDSAEIAVMRRIIPHVKRAGEIGTALQGASLLSQLYNNLPFGLLVIDSSLEIRHGNETAYELLARPDLPLSESRGKLLAPGQKNAGELQRLVAAAFSQTDGVSGPGGTILLPAEATSGEARLLVSIAPLAPSIAYGLPVRRSVVVMLREIMAETIEPLSRSLPGLFKLSRTESLIAAALAQGKRLQDVAEERGIQVKTARGYLEAIFRKTGTHRQSELVALLRSTQPLLRPPPSENEGA